MDIDMLIHDDKGQVAAIVHDTNWWDKPPRQGRSKYNFERMDNYFRPLVRLRSDALTVTEVIVHIIPLTPDNYFRSSHLRYYERDLKPILFEEKLRNA